MVLINLLQGLSYTGAVKLLLEEGYIEDNCIERDDESCDKLFLYPYLLIKNGKLIDRIYYVEYCNLDEDGDYEDFKSFWSRE